MSTTPTRGPDSGNTPAESGRFDPTEPLTRAFAHHISGRAPEPLRARVSAAAAAALRATFEGHVCVDLARVIARSRIPGDADPAAWRAALLASGVVGGPGGRTPLVLDTRDRLYLLRYWDYEEAVAREWQQRNSHLAIDVADPDAFAGLVGTLCGEATGKPATREQRAAVAVAVLHRVAVISGGPGTGKTTTAARVLAAIAMTSGERMPRMALAAPTGKAAARLVEAMSGTLAGLVLPDDVRRMLPVEASTLHRLLGARPDGTGYRHHRGAPLPYDCVLVDEASMIDIALMARLLEALHPAARLILLGDPDQLEAVEAGAVLASLTAGPRAWPEPVSALVQKVAAMDVPVAHGLPTGAGARARLTQSRRFDAGSAIGRLAAAVRDSDADGAAALLAAQGAHRGVVHLASRDALRARIVEGLAGFAQRVAGGATPTEVLAGFGAFRVLAAHREGRNGARGLNAWITRLLRGFPGLASGRGEWFPGRAVLIERNDARLGLANGDIGIVLPDNEGRLRVWFDRGAGDPVSFAPLRLPQHADAFAMTVHKSQGSEFDDVVLVLPDNPSPVVTRELLYTAITRARRSVALAGPEAVFRAGLAATGWRDGGLADRLWATPAEGP